MTPSSLACQRVQCGPDARPPGLASPATHSDRARPSRHLGHRAGNERSRPRPAQEPRLRRRADRARSPSTSSAAAASGCARRCCCWPRSACGYAGRDHYTLAAVIELIHTATLLHDDVVDESSLRRGRATANAMFGNAASVLVGDFLYSRAVPDDGRRRTACACSTILADATNVIAEGEVLQLMNMQATRTSTRRRYLERDPAQDRQAVRGRGAARRGAGRTRSPRSRMRSRATACISAPRSRSIDDVLDYAGDRAEHRQEPRRRPRRRQDDAAADPRARGRHARRAPR